MRDDPEPAAFERWLLEQCLADPTGVGVGALRTMAQDVLLEWRLARKHTSFRRWLARGAPSDDAGGEPVRAPGRPPGKVASTER